jgi:hypothetical protein
LSAPTIASTHNARILFLANPLNAMAWSAGELAGRKRPLRAGDVVLPRGDGFVTTSIDGRHALRDNIRAFTGRLRKVGFYRDLSDAYVTQSSSHVADHTSSHSSLHR